MSVHPHGKGYQVKWRDLDGKQRGHTVALKGDAEHLDASIKRAKRLGPILYRELVDSLDGGMTLRRFVAEEFREHLTAANRSRKTREQYEWALQLHLAELAGEPLTALDVPRLTRHQSFLLANGRSVHTTRTAMTMLGGILQVAVANGHLLGNPVRAMTKATAEAKPEVDPLSPVQGEALLSAMTGRDRIVCLLGYRLGLRPREIRLVEFDGFDGETLRVARAQTKRTAQVAGARTIRVDAATAHDLKLWRLQSGARGADPIVGPLSEQALKMWWQRTGKTIARKATGRDVTLYTLRHSHASALHYLEGMTVPAAAKRMGHGPALHLTHYAHVVEALERRPKVADLDALIASAQAELAGGWQPAEATG